MSLLVQVADLSRMMKLMQQQPSYNAMFEVGIVEVRNLRVASGARKQGQKARHSKAKCLL